MAILPGLTVAEGYTEGTPAVDQPEEETEETVEEIADEPTEEEETEEEQTT
ncbi:MAG: hypothetical protein ACLS7Z_06870 [Christensenellales bacterium]